MYYYAVLSYQDAAGKRHQKWVSTGLPQKGNKRRAEQELIRIRSEFEIPPAAGELNSNMLFADYLDQWLEVVRARIKPATFGSYQGMVKSTIGPYFREKELTLKELEARHIQQFYTEKLKTVTPNSVIHYHAVIYPEIMNKEQLRKACHISKRTAHYLLQFNLIPHVCTGKKTRCYAIKKRDVIDFMINREINPSRYIVPTGW